MLRARVATAAVAIPILLAIIFAGPPAALAVLIFVLGCVAVVEYMRMAFAGRSVDVGLGVAAGVFVLAVATASPAPGPLLHGAFAAVVAVLLVSVVLRPVEMADGLRDASISLMGIAYVAILAHFVWLRHLPDGPYWVTFIVANGMASDTGAYFTGKTFGRHKLSPRVSPGKTVEGAVGNLAAAALVGLLGKWLFFPEWTWWGMAVLAMVLAAIGQFGDLCESAIKRAFGSKESGAIFPGHGGVLDRIDSLLFPVAILYYHVSLA